MMLLENENMIRYLDDHGITLDAINRFKLGIRKYQKNLWLVYPSRIKGVPKYIKYRLLPFDREITEVEKEKNLTKFKREKGAPSILFNQDIIDEFDDIIVTEEGEYYKYLGKGKFEKSLASFSNKELFQMLKDSD